MPKDPTIHKFEYLECCYGGCCNTIMDVFGEHRYPIDLAKEKGSGWSQQEDGHWVCPYHTLRTNIAKLTDDVAKQSARAYEAERRLAEVVEDLSYTDYKDLLYQCHKCFWVGRYGDCTQSDYIDELNRSRTLCPSCSAWIGKKLDQPEAIKFLHTRAVAIAEGLADA